MIVLDTNVVSELMRPTPAPPVVQWLATQPDADLHTTTITLAEIRYGIARLPEGRRKARMHTSAEEAFAMFPEELLPFDTAAAWEYAEIVAARRQVGRPVDAFDAQIAAICRATGSILATRNEVDFDGVGLDIIDPWA